MNVMTLFPLEFTVNVSEFDMRTNIGTHEVSLETVLPSSCHPRGEAVLSAGFSMKVLDGTSAML